MYSLSPVNQIWLAQSFDLYFHSTGDTAFLKDRAYPYFAETAQCILGILREHKDGLLYLPISSSPEIHDDETESWLTPNSNYDLALLRYLFLTLVRYSRLLENGQEGFWQHVLDRLPELAVNDQHVLMLSPDESLQQSHRHLSNAMAVCPLHLLHYDRPRDREIIDAVVLDYEKLGTGQWIGFSFGWMAHLYAIQGNGEGAWQQLRTFWECFCSPNGFHLNGDYRRRGVSAFHYRPFTLESNMYAADALQEMLMQMVEDQLVLFPALPESWQKQSLSFTGFRGEKGLLVSAAQAGGMLTAVTLEAHLDQDIVLLHPSLTCGEKALHLAAGEKQTLTFYV